MDSSVALLVLVSKNLGRCGVVAKFPGFSHGRLAGSFFPDEHGMHSSLLILFL